MNVKPRIFLSAVSREFSSTRQVLRDALTRGGCDVEVQPDFPQSAVDTIEKLDQIIQPCDVVVHVAGIEPGSTANEQAVNSFIEHLGDRPFLADWPDLRGAVGDGRGLTYTQWEAFLALHNGVTLMVYAPADRDESFAQHQHLQRLESARRYASDYEDESDLTRKVMADLMNHFRSHLSADQLPAVFQSKPNNLPFLSLGSLFKGREQFLSDLRRKLGAEPGGAAAITTKPQAVHGSGGVGKTRAAIEYAWQHERDYSALLFVTADSPQSLDANLANLTGVLGIEEMESADNPTRLAAVLDWLQTHSGWFAILDNVDDPGAAKAVKARLTDLRHGDVVITSRISQWSAGVERLDLDVIELESARDYLLEATADDRRRMDDETEPADADQVARDVGRLALGLEHAVAYINAHGLTFADYSRLWSENAESILEEFDLQQIEYPREILVTWKLSADRLSRDARSLLNIVCWFAPDPIPESLLDTVPEAFPLAHPRNALAELVRYSLARRERDTKVFVVHRLVQATTQYHLHHDADAEKMSSLDTALNWLNVGFVGNTQDVRDWPTLDPLQSHVDTVCDHAERHQRTSEAHPTTRLLNRSGLLYLDKARYAEAEPLMRRALAIDEQSYGDQHANVAGDLNNLAWLLKATNRLAEAEPLMVRAVTISEKSYGENHPNVATALNNLAQLLHDTNRLADAEPLMARVVTIFEKSYGENHPNVGTAVNNLAQLLKATNRLAEAEPLMRRALAIDEQSYGDEHPKVATDLNNLAQLLQATNRLAEAEPLMRRALAIDEQSFRDQHPDVARDLNNLAMLLLDTNRLAEAEPLMRRALAIDEQSYGAEHPDIARDLSNLALLLTDTNRLAEAEPTMRRNVIILHRFGETTGHEHPHMQAAIANYRILLSQMKLPEDEITRRIHEATS